MKKAGNLPAIPPVLAPWQHRRTGSTKQFFPSTPINARFIAPAGFDLLALLTPSLHLSRMELQVHATTPVISLLSP